MLMAECWFVYWLSLFSASEHHPSSDQTDGVSRSGRRREGGPQISKSSVCSRRPPKPFVPSFVVLVPGTTTVGTVLPSFSYPDGLYDRPNCILTTVRVPHYVVYADLES